jgi:hypothetical protein
MRECINMGASPCDTRLTTLARVPGNDANIEKENTILFSCHI